MSDICKIIGSNYNNTMLKKVVNVYQLNFKNFRAPGFGDYLRGCFCMQQLLRTVNTYCGTNIEFDLDLTSHPMTSLLKHSIKNSIIPYDTIINFKIVVVKLKKDPENESYQLILEQMVNYLNGIKTPTFYTFCCLFEIHDEIPQSDKDFILSKLTPNNDMSMYIINTMRELNIQPKKYSVIHLRCVDELTFPDKPLSADYIDYITELINSSIDHSKKYILVTNHNDLKKIFKNRFASYTGKICHTGLDEIQPLDSVRDTMLDFFLMSKASDIVTLSPYDWGSGFSIQCAKLYNIPYSVKVYRYKDQALCKRWPSGSLYPVYNPVKMPPLEFTTLIT